MSRVPENLKYDKFFLTKLSRKKVLTLLYEELNNNLHRNTISENLTRFLHTINSVEIIQSDERLGKLLTGLIHHSDKKSNPLDTLQALIIFLERNLEGELFLQSESKDSLKERQVFPARCILENVRSSANVGNIVRTCEAMGFEEVILTGYTSDDSKKINRYSKAASTFIELTKMKSTVDVINKLKPQVNIYALEVTDSAEELPLTQLLFPLCVILGNERFGIDEANLKRSDKIIKIPMYGKKTSLNVSAAFSIFAYEARRQWESAK